MERRTFLKGTLTGAAVLAVGTSARSESPAGHADQKLRVFSPAEAATLSAAAARVVAPLDARELQVVAKIDSLLAGADDLAQGDLKRLLWVFDSAFASLFFDGRLARFEDLGPAEQDAALASWRDSRLPFRRSGFQALQRLCLAVTYATPSVYPAIGYPGPPFLVRPDGVTVGGMPAP
jgi:hypothetical protein